MRFPEIAYQYVRPKDVSGPGIEIYSRTLTLINEADASLEQLFGPIPSDKIFILTNVSVFCNPAAAECTSISVLMIGPQGIQNTIANENFAGAAATDRSLNWQGEVWILGGAPNTLRMTAAFDDAVANSMFGSAFGYVIPRANVAQF